MKIKGFEAKTAVDQFQHDALHSEELLRIYPDLSIVATSLSKAIYELEYFSASISSEVNQFDFIKENTTTYIYTHVVKPYKNIQINCSKCDGIIRVNSNPSRVPLFLEHETMFGKEYTISCFVYEDLLKAHSFSSKTLAESQLYIISKLEEHTKNNHKIDIFALSNSIKRLLPFA